MNTEYNDEYATCAETYVTLIVRSPAGDPDRVTELLALQPTKSHRSGEFNASGAIARDSAWFLESRHAVDSRDVRRHVDWITSQFPRHESVFDQLREEGWETIVSVFWVSATGHGGPALDVEQVEGLFRLKLPIWFDVYFDHE